MIDHLVTAHHANDVVETIFINLLRGTGIKGLKGIPEKKANTVRPLLNFTKDELIAFAKKENINYRTDKSNLEAKYDRNFLRLEILPKLKKLHPNLEQTFLNNVANFKEEAEIVNEFLTEKTKQLVSKKETHTVINKVKLKKEKHLQTLLHHILEPFGFTLSQINDIKTNLVENGETGKLFFTSSFTLTIDRAQILIKPAIDKGAETIQLNSLNELKSCKFIKLAEIKEFKSVQNNQLVIEKSKLIFPLTIRQKKTGDKFKPFGMKGFKLISDFLKDKKLNVFEKENCRLLENGNGDIIWVMGYRSDDRYKINTKKNNLLKLTLVE